MINKQLRIDQVYEGRMGNVMRPAYEIYIDGELVGFAKQKWLAQAIGRAILEGYIEATGDTTMAFAKWAASNAPTLFDRMPERI